MLAKGTVQYFLFFFLSKPCYIFTGHLLSVPGNLLVQILAQTSAITWMNIKDKVPPKTSLQESFLEIKTFLCFVFKYERASNHQDKGKRETGLSQWWPDTQKRQKMHLQADIVFAHSPVSFGKL